MIRAVLLVLTASLMTPLADADEPGDFYGPTGLPFSGYIGDVEVELARVWLHFDLTAEQEASLSEEIVRHRIALERMDSLHHTLEFQHTIDQLEIAGGHDEMLSRDPELGPLRVGAYNKLLDAQAKLESQLIERIRETVVPPTEVVWQDYLLTRDFERWRQPSWHESFGETIDPLLLILRVQPGFANDPAAVQAVRQVRKEAHGLAAEMIVAYQRDEVSSMQVFNHVKAADPERSSDLQERALVASFELAAFLWTIPNLLAEAGLDDFDARRYHDLFIEQQVLVRRLNRLSPIEDRIAGALFVKDALKLPILGREQHDRLRAMWNEMQEAYNRAGELHYKFNDTWMRTGELNEREEYPSEVHSIFREASKKPDEIASILTLPQWYEVVRYNEFWGRQLYESHPDYETFDWWSLDFEVLIPE